MPNDLGQLCKAAFCLKDLKHISQRKSAYRKAKKGKDTLNHIPKTQPSVWLEMHDKGKIGLLRSAKADAALHQIRGWLKEAPLDKIIVFSQWIEPSTIIGRALAKENLGFVYYTVNQVPATNLVLC